MAKEVKKKVNKIGKLLRKGQQDFEGTKKRSTKYFSKADIINLAQFLVRRARRSNALGSAHQRGRASGIVDGIFPSWLSGSE